jgi:hypothetical protein
MASDVDIANLALSYMETAPIVSFLDNVEQARLMNASYAILRDNLQRIYRWNFNRVYQQLPALSGQPSFEYEYAYQLPADCLRLEQCGQMTTALNLPQVAGSTATPPISTNGISMPGMDLTNFQNGRSQDYRVVGNRQVYSHIPPPMAVIYAQRVTDPNMFDAGFVECFACFLAWKLGPRINSSIVKKRDLKEDFGISLRQAVLTKSVELPPEHVPDDTWVMSRIAS